MTENMEHECPECASELQEIVIIDRSRLNEFRSADGVLSYTSVDAKPSIWTGSIPAEGSVASYVCTKCGRIVLYARKA